ncbi:MAG TPA: hypothetical protein VGJ26_07430 [Pirellulales bacterium]|jgi:hypothetical protein
MALKDWPDKDVAEQEIVQKLYDAARGLEAAKGVDVAAAKFLLINLWPARWSVSPHPTKPSPFDDSPVESQGAPQPEADRPPGAPDFDIIVFEPDAA